MAKLVMAFFGLSGQGLARSMGGATGPPCAVSEGGSDTPSIAFSETMGFARLNPSYTPDRLTARHGGVMPAAKSG
jgi:hypothetical protein